jgi:hypothetical protein
MLALIRQQIHSRTPRPTRPATTRWWCWFGLGGGLVGEGLADLLQVESQPAVRTAEAHSAELVGVGVDPFAVNAEDLGDAPRVDVPDRAAAGSRMSSATRSAIASMSCDDSVMRRLRSFCTRPCVLPSG